MVYLHKRHTKENTSTMDKPTNDNDVARIAEIKHLIAEFKEKFKAKTFDLCGSMYHYLPC